MIADILSRFIMDGYEKSIIEYSEKRRNRMHGAISRLLVSICFDHHPKGIV